MAKKSKENIEKVVKDTPKPSNSLRKTIQQCIPVNEVYEDGILHTKDGFSKAYKFSDINFLVDEEQGQEDVLIEFERFLNKFNASVSMQIVFVGKFLSEEKMNDKYFFEMEDEDDTLNHPYGKENNEWRKEINSIVEEKASQGHSNIEKSKYCILTVRCKDIESARQQFVSLDTEMVQSFLKMGNSKCEVMSLYEYAELLYNIYHSCDDIPFEKLTQKYVHHDDKSIDLQLKKLKENATTLKNIVAPTRMCIENKQIVFQRVKGKERLSRTIMTTSFPPFLDTKFMNDLITVPCEMVVCLNLVPYTKKKANAQVKIQNNAVKADVIKAQQSAYKQGYSPDLISDDLILAQTEARDLRKDVLVDGKKLFKVSLFYTMFGETVNELDVHEIELTDKLGDYSVPSMACTGQQLNAFNSCLPLGVSEVALDATLTSASCCAFNPYNIQELMDRQGYFYGVNDVSKNVITYSRKRSSLANGLILGQAGSGKSFLAKCEMISTMLATDDKIFSLDPENEYRVVVDAFHGVTIDLKPSTEIFLNPCDLNLEFENTEASPLAEKCDYMVGLVESMLGNGRECNAHQVNAIHKATEEMYKPYIAEMNRRYEEGDKRGLDTSICPTLEDFFKCLIGLNSPEAINLSQAVEPYCRGQYSMFAHRTNFDSQKERFINFNLLYLPDKMREVAMKVVLSYVWTEICKNKEARDKARKQGLKYTKSVWVYLDEFHLFFKTRSSADTIMSYYKRVRKYGGIMTGITQDIADLLNNEQGEAMYNNTGFIVVLKQSTIGRQKWQALFQCSDRMIDYLKDKPSGIGLISNNKTLVPFDFKLPNDTRLYKLISTNPND